MLQLPLEKLREVREGLERLIVGCARPLDHLLSAVLAGGHVLLEDVPGMGKTLAARTLAGLLDLQFARIQFTPDLLPSDITGSSVFNQAAGDFEFRPGPVFCQILLADEINRATPRTQAALLESMQEGQVTVEGTTYTLARPFMVIATQNPVELAGTFPLSEAQVDRFLMRITFGYPSRGEELQIMERFLSGREPAVQPVLDGAGLLSLMSCASRVHMSQEITDYIIDIVRATREHREVRLGASPRAALMLGRACKALAVVRGRDFVIPDDVQEMVVPVLGHRLVLAGETMLRETTQEILLREVLAGVSAPVEDRQ